GEPAGDPQEQSEDDEVRNQLADRDVVVVEGIPRRLPRSEALCIAERGEGPDQGTPCDELAVRQRNASGCRIFATSTSAEPMLGPGTASLAFRMPKRPLRTAWMR